ncbi:MAG TPA: serine hydrolase domain-containing protein [Gemmatimonadaceae bacterium]
MKRLLLIPAVLAVTACASTNANRVRSFERDATEIRNALRIPGMSAAILENQKILWTRAFGYADVENKVPATPETLYSIASVTKTFGSTLLMQLVEKGRVSLDEPIADYPRSSESEEITDKRVKIRHILSHTSDGTPGEEFKYNGARYDMITSVIEKKYGAPFREVIARQILDPLHMNESVPGHNVINTPELARRYAPALAHFAKPYAFYGNGEVVDATYPGRNIGASAGLITNVKDLAKFDIAIDRHILLKKETQQLAWTPFVSNSGKTLPYGLGWFVENYRGERLVWHSGNWGSGFSALYFKIPARNLTLILLANSEALSDPFWVPGQTNPFACSFLRHFVFKSDDPCEQAADSAVSTWVKGRAEHAEPTIALDESVLASYAGEYGEKGKRTYTVTREGTRLFINIPTRDDRLEMFASPKGDFFFKVTTPTRVRFVREGANVTRLEFHFGEGEEPVKANRIR